MFVFHGLRFLRTAVICKLGCALDDRNPSELTHLAGLNNPARDYVMRELAFGQFTGAVLYISFTFPANRLIVKELSVVLSSPRF